MMLLKALNAYAEFEKLVESIELTERPVHLVLGLRKDGSVDQSLTWRALPTTEIDSKGKTKITLGQSFTLPAFPGVNSGGKAKFLVDDIIKVLGIDSKSGEPLADDATSNAAKSFRHFWQRIVDAHSATKLEELQTLLDFRDRYLLDPETRRSFPRIGVVSYGKKAPKPTLCALTDDGPIPLEKRIVTFSIDGEPLFLPNKPLHSYWKMVFARERFAESTSDTTSGLGVCLVTGQENQLIAEAHRTPIKGVPGLPLIGGYLVSFDDSTPALRSYCLDKAFQAPVSEQTAAAYALGLNHILNRSEFTRKFVRKNEATGKIEGFVICSWIHEAPDLSERVNGVLIVPTLDAVHKFNTTFAREGRLFKGWSTKHFRSVTLAANGGRVVVRRWLDVPLGEIVNNLNSWLNDLILAEVQPPPVGAKSNRGKTSLTTDESAHAGSVISLPYRSIDALAWTTSRKPSTVRSSVYDALYRAAYQGFNPEALLPAVLHRLKIAAIKSGSNLRYHTSRFALIKLILKRSGNAPMSIEPQLCETYDKPYNCGRLLAVLDDIQYQAHKKDVGADVIARYYGNASTFPANVLPRLLRLSNAHLGKLAKGDEKSRKAGRSLQRRLNSILALFRSEGPENVSEFPGLLDIRQQGRFALGFYQQKAHDQRRIDAIRAAKDAQTKKPN
jgi:CRISPR-associated protein Csd1